MALKKIKNNKKPKTIIIFILFAILLALGAGIYLYYLRYNVPSSTKSSDSASEVSNSIKSSADSKDQSDNNNADTEKSPDTTNDQSSVTDNSNTDGISLSIDSFNQENGEVSVKSTVTNVSSGSCNFIFSTDYAKPVNKSSTIISNRCNVSIPEVEFSKTGQWKLIVQYKNGNKTKQAVQNVTIN